VAGHRYFANLIWQIADLLRGVNDGVINTLWAWMGAMGVAPMKGIVGPAYNVYATGA
jgi:hypothetical protein